ncbi:hypothetical protein GCM10027036_03290 [Flavihumibacter cheonanensis]|uniref:hypothetical protein n=1 Tax=Flavihumibacter TaxID=1004301 RepID=UPI001EF823D2|nr:MULTISPECIES: hypothetical protein [Flavihumibacter]MCG7752227.1 hypothetical protein [Flavihumibacter cheonanensis]
MHTPSLQKALVLIAAVISLFSCKKEFNASEQFISSSNEVLGSINSTSSSGSTGDYCWEDAENGLQSDSVLKPTILGSKLLGAPYSLVKMKQAYVNLTGSSIGVVENQKYIRFKPTNNNQLAQLEDMDIDLFDYPLDYELIQEGDYYDDGVTPIEQIPWLYAVVDMNFVAPSGITTEVLQTLHVPNDYRIENEAFRITGNYVDTAGCSSGSSSAIMESMSSSSCDCSSRPSALECDCRVVCGFSPCLTPLPPVPVIRIPAGKITVNDDVLQADVGIKKVRLVARRFLKIERTYTDNIGNYYFTKSFRNKFTMIMKFKNANASVYGLRGARLWRMLFPNRINMGRFRGKVNNVTYNIADNNDVRSRGAMNWASATIHNTVQEYNYTHATALGIGTVPDKLKILTLPGSGNGSAPMFEKRYITSVSNYFFRQFVTPSIGMEYTSAYLGAIAGALAGRIDLFITYSASETVTKTNDKLTELCYHELTHAAHYKKAGTAWYNNFVQAEINQIIANFNQSDAPYGPKNTPDAPIIALGESWAYHTGHYLTNLKYGALSGSFFEQGEPYSNDSPISGLSSNLNLLENFNPTILRDPFNWIPQGLYYDLMDNRNDDQGDYVPLFDNVAGYTFQQLFNSLDSDVSSIQNYKIRLLNENGNNQATGVNTIFTFYGY